jgi:DNA-binding CsgD family transcriptional regulator
LRVVVFVLGLSVAVGGFAAALLAGVSPADYARDCALSRNTVYTHLRRIKEKTHCARLPELIRKLGELQPAVRRD